MEQRFQPKKKNRRRKTERQETDLGSLYRLLICIGIFLTVFLGRGVFPVRTQEWSEQLLEVIRQDTDFTEVFGGLGEAVSGEVPVLETLDQVWVELLGEEGPFISQPHRAAAVQLRMELEQEERAVKWQKPCLASEPEFLPQPEPAVELTATQRELGLEDSVTPVMGVLTSGFGVREHPISGRSGMHDGVDIAADTGTEILAFADGKVDYIGESEAYGQYLQLRHDNGVTTFYAHCSELLVQKGEGVVMGEVVARVGSTGNTTGPHLHMEMKKDGVFIDPLPYIKYVLE